MHAYVMTSLQEENDNLKVEVKLLKKELAQRDHLIAALEYQLNHLQLLRKESQTSSMTEEGSRDTLSIKSFSLSKRASHEDSLSPFPLEPPRRSFEGETSTLIKNHDIIELGIGTRLDSKIMEGNEDGDAEVSDMGKEKRNLLKSSKGAIKALPRELSIINSESDDVTKYSRASGNFRLEKAEMRDAYNARGIYTGEISRKEQMPHGKGRMDYHLQGRFYEGDWNMGHWHGFGIIRNSYGDYYRGQIVNDLREGKGRSEYADGRVFEGSFEADDAVKGKLIFPDGAKYVGELNDGKRHGVGIYYFSDGSIYEGDSVNNYFEGKGKMIWEDGGFYEGEWAQGEIDGYGKETRPNGSIRHEGLWRNGFPVRK